MLWLSFYSRRMDMGDFFGIGVFQQLLSVDFPDPVLEQRPDHPFTYRLGPVT